MDIYRYFFHIVFRFYLEYYYTNTNYTLSNKHKFMLFRYIEFNIESSTNRTVERICPDDIICASIVLGIPYIYNNL